MESVVAFFEQRAVEVVGREFPQILLIHANQLNADQMPQPACDVPPPRLQDRHARRSPARSGVADTRELRGPGGTAFSWLHRWSRFKGMPNKGEPDPPEWVMKGF